ncbi:TerD family protein [Williamsia sp. MIQD14]|uniref:TerD family protein n=1 Tax=Williamsia sp. MIQD14 TaxID=3425703 RepID=UPI003DA1C542
MTTLSRGANAPLDERRFTATVSGPSAGTCDLMVFQVTEAGRVRSDDDFVFFNNPVAPGGAVRLAGTDAVEVDLGAVPPDVHTLRLAVVLDDSAPGTLADVRGLSVTIGALELPAEGLTTERAAVLTEIYRRGDMWKVRNVSAGWDAGFTALVTEHGVSVDDAPTASAPPPATPPPAATPPAAATPPVDLGKITLTRSAPTVSLAKVRDKPSGTMRINLNWSRGAAKGGLFRKQSGIDLDLGCLYELTDGSKSVVQALGNSFGSLNGPPWILLDGDDRSGTVSGGENLLIDLSHLAEFRRILVFAFIYEGTPNWSAADGVVTLFPPGGTEVEVRLDSADNTAMTCAIAMLEVRDGELSITREVRYINGGQRKLDEAYVWGMTWARGSK